jgi:deoxyribodipyrimidine photo-lyase
MSENIIVWFQNDLRLNDNPALNRAVQLGKKVLPIYIWDPSDTYFKDMGAASKWWLHYSLEKLSESLRTFGLNLHLFNGQADQILQDLTDRVESSEVVWNKRYDPSSWRRDAEIIKILDDKGISNEQFSSYLLFEPDSIRTKTGSIYRVFTPFWKYCLEKIEAVHVESFDESLAVQCESVELKSIQLDEFNLLPKIPWDGGLKENWIPGEASAIESLFRFVNEKVGAYKSDRDLPSVLGTSRISAHLHFGELSPRQVVHAVRERLGDWKMKDGPACYLSELGWREFSSHLLYHFPEASERPLRTEFEKFPWVNDKEGLKRWQQGKTGIPLVDAGMRELWRTGWMHNRVRMVVASFLVKNLRIHWKEGMDWFWDTLVDADLASNSLSWQWVAGCGADAAPYFRIFNPVSQGERFDPDGEYVKKWVPELKHVPKKWIHQPWDADRDLITYLGLEDKYPRPIVDLKKSRQAALDAYQKIK